MKELKDYVERMGYFPTYKHPEKIGEDEEFVYYKFRVPREYIKAHIEMGGVWEGYEPSDIPSSLDDSCVLGVLFLPVYTKIRDMGFDHDFYYYRCRVPQAFMAHIDSRGVKYGDCYNQLEEFEKSAEQKDIKAGVSLEEFRKAEQKAVEKIKAEGDVQIYEVTLTCQNPECGFVHDLVSTDLFDTLREASCSKCDYTIMKLEKCDAVLTAEENEDE